MAVGCSEDVTNPNVVNDGKSYIPSIANQQIVKPLFTIPIFFTFLNQYSNDLPTMVNVIREFEDDCYLATHKYFYLSEVLSNRILILQNSYDLFTPIAAQLRYEVETAMREGLTSMELGYLPYNGENNESGWKNFDWDNPQATPPNTNMRAIPGDNPDRLFGPSFPIDCCLVNNEDIFFDSNFN